MSDVVLLHPAQACSPWRVRRIEDETGLVAVPASCGRLVVLVPPDPDPPAAGRSDPLAGRSAALPSINQPTEKSQ